MNFQLYLLYLTYCVSHSSAIPFGPFGGPEFALALWHLPVVKNFWGQKSHIPEEFVSNIHIESGEQLLGWHDPRKNGGRMLDYTVGELGEPLNVIISSLSDPYILTEAGFHHYTKSLGFSEECLGIHYGNLHEANLGDGDSRKLEQFLARQHYFPIWGTCWESLAGGHHFRAWKQNGTLANSGAWFLGASKELDSRKHHTIVPNGYNLGRDYIVARATIGGKWKGMAWRADVEWVSGLLEEGSEGVNHGIEQDGRVAVLTVRRV